MSVVPNNHLDAVLNEVFRQNPKMQVIRGYAECTRDDILKRVEAGVIESDIKYIFNGNEYYLKVILKTPYLLPCSIEVVQYRLTFNNGDNSWVSYKEILDAFEGNEEEVRKYILDLLLKKTPRGNLSPEQEKYANFFAALLTSAELLRARQSIAVVVLILFAIRYYPKNLKNALYTCSWFTKRGAGSTFRYSSIDTMKRAIAKMKILSRIRNIFANELIIAYNLEEIPEISGMSFQHFGFGVFIPLSVIKSILNLYEEDKARVEKEHPVLPDNLADQYAKTLLGGLYWNEKTT